MKRDPSADFDDEDLPATPTPKKARTIRTPRSTAKGKAALSQEMIQEDDESGQDSNVKVERMGRAGGDADAVENDGNGDEDVSNDEGELQLQVRGELLTGAGILSPVKEDRIKTWKARARGLR